MLAFGFDRPAALDEGDRALSQALAGLCAQAIERARLYEVEQGTRSRLQQILDVLPEAVLVVDAAGRFALANAARQVHPLMWGIAPFFVAFYAADWLEANVF